ncbi:MAG: response regulator [Nitrospiria bacterium]
MDKAKRIHVIEDEEDIARLIQYNLALERFEVSVSNTGEIGFAAIGDDPPDLILLDLMLPGIDGLEICRLLKAKEKTSAIPIVIVTAKGTEQDIVRGLELGADDYITKPFSPKVLVARVKAVFRRLGKKIPSQAELLKVGDLAIHPGKFEVMVSNQKIDLTRSEFQILHYLSQRPGWVFTRSQIVDAIHGDDYAVTDRTIDFQMVGLRKKLGAENPYIETVRGVGYRFREEV